MSREHQQLRVRVPPDLKDDLDKAAEHNNRTLTAEIVYRLQKSFEDSQEPSVHEMKFKVADHRIPPSESQKLKGLLARMLEIIDVTEQDENRELIEENEAYDRRAELEESERKELENKRKMDKLKKSF
ncbi:MAG: Arc family DNA-binding protein [Tolumonas sp.]|nr:Arc family DNA-binding protein [Tolumonas sp.]